MQILKKNGLTAFCLMAAKWDSFKTGVNVIIQFRLSNLTKKLRQFMNNVFIIK